jgi:hypothetical protein
VSNFGGGLAYVHGGEVLANLAPGTDVIPRNQVGKLGKGGGGGNTYYLSGNMMTPEFWAQIKGEVSAGEHRSMQWAATNVPALAQSRSAKQQQYTVGRRQR